MNEAKIQRTLKVLLLTLVYLLTFEGLARKIHFPGLNLTVFLLKDVLITVIAIQTLRLKLPSTIHFLWNAYLVTFALFIPVIIVTTVHDPFLAVFGTKEYLLYPFVAFALFSAFHNAPRQEIVRFFQWIALLIIPTTIAALVQMRLSPTDWINLSVDGNSLANFSAGGQLRVSSTFSFVAQYSAFLNAQVFMTAIALIGLRELKFFWKWIYLGLIPLLVISSYVTGSRGAVVANMAIIVVAGSLSLLKFQVRSALRVVFIFGSMILITVVTKYFFPDIFAAYSARESGQLVGVSSEVQGRIYGALFSWMENILTTPFFGNGIGVMCNGSEFISSYAAACKSRLWTETDYAMTLYEGGIYLVIVWYGFRFYVIYQTLRRFLLHVSGEVYLSASFCQSFVIIIGITETLALQPPIAIWWWLSVGSSLLLWWKCVQPNEDDPDSPPPAAAPPTEKRIRGRSAYAERLHGNK